jgi:hypothetical protein
MTAQYWIAQHIEDLFRNEPRNVGVLLHIDNKFSARFFGEDEVGQLDGRRLRVFSHPDAYRQWVEFWRREAPRCDPADLERLNGRHYRVIEGGELTDYAPDSIIDVTKYLYALLVSEGGLREALGAEEESPVRLLESDIVDAFRAQQILADVGPLFARHPIERGRRVEGVSAIHRPTFVQENGRLCLMETIDFTIKQKQRSRDHAGLSAYMFRDVRNKRPEAEAIAIVRITDADMVSEDVQYGFQLLQSEAAIVDWLNENTRSGFLEERKRIAGVA